MSTTTTLERHIAAARLRERGYQGDQLTEILDLIFSEQNKPSSPKLSALRLELMKHINHPESYYQAALRSQGIDHTTLTHEEVATFVATCKAIEADIMMAIALNLPKTEVTEDMVNKVAPAASSASEQVEYRFSENYRNRIKTSLLCLISAELSIAKKEEREPSFDFIDRFMDWYFPAPEKEEGGKA